MNNKNNNPYHEYENIIYPALIINKDGFIIHKNSYAAKMKFPRKGTQIRRLLITEASEQIGEYLADNKAGIFRCNIHGQYSEMVLLPIEGNTFCAYMIVNSTLFKIYLNKAGFSGDSEYFSSVESIIKKYKNVCKLSGNTPDGKINAIISNNSLQFAKASRMFCQHLDSLRSIEGDTKSEIIPISDICRKITRYFSETISSRGYRLSLEMQKDDLCACINKASFASVFTSIIGLALQMSTRSEASIKIIQGNEQIIDFLFSFSPIEGADASEVFACEIEQLEAICYNQKWSFSGIKFDRDKAYIKLSVPVGKIISISLHAPISTLYQNIIFKYADEEIACLPYLVSSEIL